MALWPQPIQQLPHEMQPCASRPDPAKAGENPRVEMLPLNRMDPLFAATVQATEEAIINALVAAETMTGIDGRTVIALPHDRLKQVMGKYNRLDEGRPVPAREAR